MNLFKAFAGILLMGISSSVYATTAPESFTVSESSDTSISFDWEDVPSAEGYYIYYGTNTGSGSTYEVEGVDLIQESDFVLTGLQAGTKYYVAITAIDEFGKESEFSKELEYSTLALGSEPLNASAFRIVNVEVIDKNTLELQFNTTLDSSTGASRSFIIEDKQMGTELPVDISQVDESNTKNIFLLLGVDLSESTNYKVTVLELRDNQGNTIESGIDAFVDFTTPTKFGDISLDAAPEGQEPVVPSPIAQEPETQIVETQTPEKEIKISKLNSDMSSSSSTKAGVTLTDEELPKDKITKAATQLEKLPNTGPELWILFICIGLFVGGLLVIAKNKKAL